MELTVYLNKQIPSFKEILAQEYAMTAAYDPVRKTESIKNSLRNWLVTRGYDVAIKALDLGAKYHKGTRKDKVTPEFSHSLTVTRFLQSLRLPKKLEEWGIAVGILHDTVEDYPQALREMNEFPKHIKRDVVLLAKVRGKKKLETSAYYKKLAESAILSMVKGLDRLHNAKTMGPFSAKKKVEYAQETYDRVFPMLDKAARKFPEAAQMLNRIKTSIQRELEKVFRKDGIHLPAPA